jgi:hypothetical protein
MNLPPDQTDALLSQFCALHEDQLPDVQRRAIRGLVAASAETRQLYVEHAFLITALRWTYSDFEDALPVATDTTMPVLSPAVPTRLANVAYGVNLYRNPVYFIPASVIIVGLFWTFWAYLIYAGRSEYQNRPQESAMAAVATLTADRDCIWHADSQPKKLTVGLRLGADGVLQLQSGVAELTFLDGARVAIEGPCQFELQGSGKGFLQNGKLVAHVPPRAIGFEIETPTARIVDLGTDFKVEASSSETKVAVIAGMVDLFPRDRDVDDGKRTTGSHRRVVAGQAVAITAQANGTTTMRQVRYDAALPSKVVSDLPHDRHPSPVVAYQVSENAAGNQRDFHGGVGLDFEVRAPIRVFSLGVFDHLGDGIDRATSPTVQLWSRDMTVPLNTGYVGHKVLASHVFDAHDSGQLKSGHRFKSLARPINLPVGAYSIVAYGLSNKNPFIDVEDRNIDVDFSSEPHWVGSNNTTSGNKFGWNQAIDKTGRKVSEVGGTFARAQLDSFYADTHLSDAFDLGDRIAASGTFRMDNITEGWADLDSSSGFFIGHFSRNAASQDFIGLEFKESGSRFSMQVRARFQQSGAMSAQSDWVSVLTNDSHTFSYTYVPYEDNGRLTLSIDAMSPLIVELKPIERGTDVQFNAFGIGATSNLNSENDPTKTAEVYLDDVSYSGCRTRSSKDSIGLEKSTAHVQVETSHNAIVPRGSRFGECEPGTLPAGRRTQAVDYAAGSFEYFPVGEESTK